MSVVDNMHGIVTFVTQHCSQGKLTVADDMDDIVTQHYSH